MRILMMGTGPFAVPTFEWTLASDHQVIGLVTRPDKVARGRKKAPRNPMRETANANHVDVYSPESINSDEGLSLLEEMNADLFIVCDYGQILSQEALTKARLGGINLHGSLLPKYRGAAPINWALLNGDTEAGITVIHMTSRLDGGPMLCKRSLQVGPDENASELEPRLSELGVDGVRESLELLETWDGTTQLGELQNRDEVTKAPRLLKSDGLINWTHPAIDIKNRVRALQPWPGTFSNLLRPNKEPMRVIFRAVGIAEIDPTDDSGPGRARLVNSHFTVQCGDGAVTITHIQPAGKREMTAEEFARGYGAELQFGSETQANQK